MSEIGDIGHSYETEDLTRGFVPDQFDCNQMYILKTYSKDSTGTSPKINQANICSEVPPNQQNSNLSESALISININDSLEKAAKIEPVPQNETQVEVSQNSDRIEEIQVDDRIKSLIEEIKKVWLENSRINQKAITNLFFKTCNLNIHPKIEDILSRILRGLKKATLQAREDLCELYNSDLINYCDLINEFQLNSYRPFADSSRKIKPELLTEFKFDPKSYWQKQKSSKTERKFQTPIRSKFLEFQKKGSKSCSKYYAQFFLSLDGIFGLFKLYIDFIFSDLQCAALRQKLQIRPCNDNCNEGCILHWNNLKTYLQEGFFLLSYKEKFLRK